MKKALIKLKNFALRSTAGRLLLVFITIVSILQFDFKDTSAYLLTTPDSDNGGKGITATYAYPIIECRVTGQEVANAVQKVIISPENTNVDSYVRAAVIMTWQHTANQTGEQGHIFGTLPKEFADYFKIEMGTQGWVKGDDGYYYGTNPVKKGNNPAVLIINCERGTREAPEGYQLVLEVLAEAIQAEPSDAVTSAWGVQVNSDGTLKV